MTAPNSPLSIRTATPHDLEAIQDIAYKTWPVTYGSILNTESLDYMLNYFYSIDALSAQMNSGQQFFMATFNDSPVGFGSVSRQDQHTFKLNKLYVLPGIQKTGAGKALMDHAFEIAKKSNASHIILNVNRNNPAIGFYQKLGFIILRSEDVDLGNGVVQEDYVMEFSLTGQHGNLIGG
jgi:ribosomal protein S18 acetylase RimI-like enzyme